MIISKEYLKDIKGLHPKESIGFTTGAFHILHPGHVWFLNSCKKHCSKLVVGIAHDEITQYKRTTHLNNESRMYVVNNLRSVDYVVLEDNKMPPDNVSDLVKLLQPNVWITNTDNPNLDAYLDMIREINKGLINPIYFTVQERRNKGIYDISTSDLINKIRNSYDRR